VASAYARWARPESITPGFRYSIVEFSNPPILAVDYMTGLSTFIFATGMVLVLVLAYAGGVPGWVAGAALLFGGWIAIAFMHAADPAVLAVQALAGLLTLVLSLRWVLHHRAWKSRLAKDRREADGGQQQVRGVVEDLKSRIAVKAAEVDQGLRQYELVKRLSEAVSWEEMAPSLEKALKHFFHAEGWALYLTNEKGELQPAHRRGVTPDPRAEDMPKKEAYLHTFIPSTGSDEGRSVWALGIPLWRLHERIGLLLVRIADLAPDQQPSLVAEANHFAVQLIFAMAKAKLYRQLEERSRTDGLTGLSRRGPFEERLREEVARAHSFKTTFSILMIDIDHFKPLNDTYGHQVGDEVLKTVAQRLKEGLYETDVIARYGGEEFVCLLPRSQPAGLKMKAERIRERVASEAFVIGLEALSVTISIGIAHFPHDGESPEKVLAAADRALYAAKAAGRNCVVEAATVT
jgi:diguanylate cyclase (GGDEF)-like protein